MKIAENIGKSFRNVMEARKLSNFDYARKVLPSDTTYAIVSEVFILKPGETTVNYLKADPGQYFAAYIALSPQKVRIYNGETKIFEDDIKNVKVSARTAVDVKEVGSAATIDALNPESSTAGAYVGRIGGAEIVIENAEFRFYISSYSPIPKTQGAFESTVTSLYGPDQPLLDRLQQGGAEVLRPTNQSMAITWIIVLIILFISISLLVKSKLQ